jgi:UDP-glucose 4-epimerase
MPAISGNKFVVVGGASLLGSHIGEQLLAAGSREVTLVDNLALGSTSNIDSLLEDSRCTFIRADITRLNELYDPFSGAAGVFHVAGFLTAPIAANPWMGLDVNVRGLQNVLEACRYQSVQKVIFSSTSGVYGAQGEGATDETDPLRWDDAPPALILYCTSKIMGEGLGRLYQQNYGLDFVTLRYSGMYGERQHKRAIDATRIVEAYDRVRSGLAPIIQGDGSGLQDYVYAGDVARANLMAMESDATGVGINIASGVATSQRSIIELLVHACGSDLKPEFAEAPDQAGGSYTPTSNLSIDAAKQLIGWEPTVFIEEGVRLLVAWLDQDRAATPSVTD